jgi:hypothetical protein
VNRKVNVKAKISFSRAGNTLDLYIEPVSGVYFFFIFFPGNMQTMSSVDGYNQNIKSLKTEERTVKGSGSVKKYMLTMSADSRLRQFHKSFEQKGAAKENEEEE